MSENWIRWVLYTFLKPADMLLSQFKFRLAASIAADTLSNSCYKYALVAFEILHFQFVEENGIL